MLSCCPSNNRFIHLSSENIHPRLAVCMYFWAMLFIYHFLKFVTPLHSVTVWWRQKDFEWSAEAVYSDSIQNEILCGFLLPYQKLPFMLHPPLQLCVDEDSFELNEYSINQSIDQSINQPTFIYTALHHQPKWARRALQFHNQKNKDKDKQE